MSSTVLEAPRPVAATAQSTSPRLDRFLVVLITGLPFLALVGGITLWTSHGFRALDLALFAAFYSLSALGVTVGFHRHFAHRSFEATRGLRVALATAGSLSVQGAVIGWVADHRRHHAFSDRPGDPHSPHLEEAQGLGGVLKGLWHAHTGWLFDEERTVVDRYAPDLLRDPAMVRVNQLFPALTAVSLALPALIGFLATWSLTGTLSAFLWGGLVRVFFLHHVTWSINSICHFFGRRPYESKDLSTNNWVLALPSFGESWHNNHHAFPTSAVHGLGRSQIDVTAMVIRGLAKAGWAWDVHVPEAEQLDRKRRAG